MSSRDSDSDSQSSITSGTESDEDIGDIEEEIVDVNDTNDNDDIPVDIGEAVESSESVKTLENNNNEAKQIDSKVPRWNGERLYPPSRKLSKPSKAWKFGGFVKNKAGLLVTASTICGLCGKQQKYRHSPTNLTQHLEQEHPLEFREDKLTNSEVKIDHFFRPKAEKAKYKASNPKQRALRAKLVEWVISSNRPLSVVEDDKLVELLEMADTQFNVPSRKTVRNDIEELYKKKKAEVVEDLSKIDFFACTNDAGSSSGGKSFVDINVHYVTEDFHLKKKILDVLEMKESKTAENYRKRVRETEKKFGLEGKVFSYTTDNEATMNAAFTCNERNGCFAHIESKSSKKALERQKCLKILRLKLRKISKKANKSSKFMYAIAEQQKKRGLRILGLKQEVKTRFTATHSCIRSFLNDPNEKVTAPIDDEKVDENIAAINHAMKDAKLKKSELTKLEIKPEDTRKMKELVKVLDVLEEGITLIGGEKFATGSAVLPFIHKFNKFLEIDDEEPLYISSFKTDLKADMNERCEANLNKHVLAKASFFDKRFSHLKFLEEEDKQEVMEDLKAELEAIEAVRGNENKDNDESEPLKKKRFLGAGFDDSDEEAACNVEGELKNYLNERKLKIDGDPFEWWRNRRDEYPVMSKLARKYLAVQGTSTPAERVISRLGTVLSKRRQSLTGEIFSKMMFLTDLM